MLKVGSSTCALSNEISDGAGCVDLLAARCRTHPGATSRDKYEVATQLRRDSLDAPGQLIGVRYVQRLQISIAALSEEVVAVR